jgi:hypothetical protein
MTRTVDRLRLADDYLVIPCGCETGTVDDAFVLRPCSLLCDWYLFTIGEAKRQGIERRTERE